MAPRCVSRRSSAPARSVRVSHDSDPASGHAPCPRPKPCPKPKPNPNPHPYLTAGRRGRKEGARLTLLPTGDHLGQRARLFVAPQPKPIAAANLCSRSRSPSHPAATAPNLLLSLNPRPPHQARLRWRRGITGILSSSDAASALKSPVIGVGVIRPPHGPKRHRPTVCRMRASRTCLESSTLSRSCSLR